MVIDKGEVLRYLGYRGQQMTPELDTLVDGMVEICQRDARPVWVVRRFEITGRGEDGVTLGGVLTLPGKDIAAHLQGAAEAAVMAVTLGVGVENMIRRLELVDMTRSLVLDSAATTMVEAACDAAQLEIAQTAQAEGLEVGGRFSPGYGDLPLEVQPDLVRVVDAGRRAGLTCTDSCILLPRKSVTAVVGLFPKGDAGMSQSTGCAHCPMRGQCNFERDGNCIEADR